MMTCRDVSTLMATDQVAAQGLLTRLQMAMHLAICRHCRSFQRQLRAMDLGVLQWMQSPATEAPADLPERLARALAANAGAPAAQSVPPVPPSGPPAAPPPRA